MHSHLLFIGNVLAHFVASMSGIVSFAMAFYEAVKNKKVQSWKFFSIGALFLLIAFDQAWQDEHRNVEALVAEKARLWQERDFWRGQSYEKDASLRAKDNLLEKDTNALADTQTGLARLSDKVLDISKPQVQKFIVTRDDYSYTQEIFHKWQNHTQMLVMTNLPITADLLVECEQPMPDLEAHILRGGLKYPDTTHMLRPNAWSVLIPSPQITPQNPLLITIGYNQESLGTCEVNRQGEIKSSRAPRPGQGP